MKRQIFRIFLLVLLCTLLVGTFSACFLLGDNNGGDKKGDLFDLSTGKLVIPNLYGNYVYMGEKICPTVEVLDSEGMWKATVDSNGTDDLDIQYKDNINVGTATITVTAKSGSKAFKGSVSMQFTIDATSVYVNSYSRLKEVVADTNYTSVTVTHKVTVPQEETLSIPANRTVTFQDTFGVDGVLDNSGEAIFADLVVNGTMTNSGTMSASNVSVKGELASSGAMTVEAGMIINGSFANSGTLTLQYNISVMDWGTSTFGSNPVLGQGFIFTYDTSDAVASDNVTVYKRMPLSGVGLTLEKDTYNYTGLEITPTIVVPDGLGLHTYSLKTTYTDNINSGTATVKLVSPDASTVVYGETELTFTILPVVKYCVFTSPYERPDLTGFLNSPNYTEVVVTLAKDGYFNCTVTVPEGKKLTFTNDFRFYTNTGLSITNYGTVVAESNFLVNKPVYNYGRLEVKGNLTVYAGDMSTQEGSTLITDGDAEFSIGTFTNEGQVTFNGKFFANGTYVNNGSTTISANAEAYFANIPQGNPLQNGGTTYVNSATTQISNVGAGTTVVRKQITAENLLLEYTEIKYDTQEHIPTVSFVDGGQNVQVPTETYSRAYSYTDPNITGRPISVGTVKYTVGFNNKSQQFCGSATVQYNIIRSEISVYNYTELSNAIKCGFYWQVTVAGSIDLDYDFVIPDYCTLLIAEYKTLTNFATLTVEGTLKVNEGGVLLNGYQFNGSDFSNPKMGSIQLAHDANVHNSGTVYFNGAALVDFPGNIVEKVNLQDNANHNFEIVKTADFVYSTSGGWYKYTSCIQLKDGETVYENTNQRDFYMYSNEYEHVGTHNAYIVATSKSLHFYGIRSLTAQILPATKEVSSHSDMVYALKDVNSEGICNYSMIKVVKDIDFTITNSTPVENGVYKVVVPQGVILDLSEHTLTVYNNASTPMLRSYSMVVKGELWAQQRAAFSGSTSYGGGSIVMDGGTFVLHVYNHNLYAMYSEIRDGSRDSQICIMEDLVAPQQNVTGYNKWFGTYDKEIVIDLNGHSIAYNLELDFHNNVVIKSSGEKGTIQGEFIHGNRDPVISGTFASHDATVSFENIHFATMTEAQLQQTGVVFENCTFKSE